LKNSSYVKLREWASRKKRVLTKGFVQLGHDVETIIGCAYPSYGFGGRNSVEH